MRVRTVVVTFAKVPEAIGMEMRVSDFLFSLIQRAEQSARTTYKTSLTGVRSREPSSSVALAAASIKSSHRFPYNAAALGSDEKALRSPLSLFETSFDFFRSCFGNRACWVRLLFLGLLYCLDKLRCKGGRVEGLSGGDLARLLGNSPCWSELELTGKPPSCMKFESSKAGSTEKWFVFRSLL